MPRLITQPAHLNVSVTTSHGQFNRFFSCERETPVSYEYSAQNHDWDLTLRAASDLVSAGMYMDQKPREGTLSMGFSYFTGGMVLSFAAVESFSASVAFCMASDPRYPNFDFERYRSTFRFDAKMNMLMEAAGIKVDWGRGLFQRIATMQRWRNLVTHATPYRITPTQIDDPLDSPALHTAKHHALEYARSCDIETARDFYTAAFDFITLVKEKTGINPCASATYVAK